jgi:hypothetical protein
MLIFYVLDVLCRLGEHIMFFLDKLFFGLSIKDSKIAKFWQLQAWLGDSLMDFLNFNHYFNNPLDIQKAIFVALVLSSPRI